MSRFTHILSLALVAWLMSSACIAGVHPPEERVASSVHPVSFCGKAAHSDQGGMPLRSSDLLQPASIDLDEIDTQNTDAGSTSHFVVLSIEFRPYGSLVSMANEPAGFLTAPLFQLFSTYRL